MIAFRASAALRSNRLLAALPRRVQLRLAPLLEPVSLSFDDVLYEPGKPMRHIYFPTSGMVTLLLVLKQGAVAEVARVGSEGMIGLPVFFGITHSHTRVLVQFSGAALRMPAPTFQQLTRLGGPLADVLLRYAQALMNHSQQLTACITWHTIEQRLCRWLLITLDRIQDSSFAVTQEFLAQMFGTHRQSVTLAASKLQKAGLIRYSRGKMTILDRAGLEQRTCECYGQIQRHCDDLLTAMEG
jgi:CRP-like cAMP-binding protein